MVHEPYVPIRDLRSLAMGAGQRAQLFAVARSAQLVLGASEAWARLVTRAARLSRRARVAAVGSNLPDARGAREAERRRLEIGSGTVVLSHLSTPHPSRPAEHVVRAANGVAAAGLRVVLLNLGAHAPSLSASTPGSPSARRGESRTRRSARADRRLRHLPVPVCRRGLGPAHVVDGGAAAGMLRGGHRVADHGCRPRGGEIELTAVGDVRDSPSASSGSPAIRSGGRLAEGARRLYVQHFSWPVLAADLARDLRSVAPGP